MRGKFPTGPSQGCHILAASWFDSGVCNMLSTKHLGHLAKIRRRVRGEKDSVERDTRDCFVDYNLFMCGVDIVDMKRAMLSSRVRSFKWWHAVFFWILDSARINSNVLYNRWAAGASAKKLDGRTFLEQLAQNLVEDAFNNGFLTSMPQDKGAARRSSAVDAMNLCRFEGQHWPCKTFERGVCVVCTYNLGSKHAQRRKTIEGCETCNKVMHIECFKSWHTQQNPVSGHA